LILLIGLSLYIYFQKNIDHIVQSLELNSDFLNYIIAAPFALSAFIFNDVRSMLVGDKDSTRVLTDWNDYWMLKTHTAINLIYTVIFLLISVVPWFTKLGINDGRNLLLFVTGLCGLLISARDIYASNIRVKELIANIRNP
jgi:hypothetical protein